MLYRVSWINKIDWHFRFVKYNKIYCFCLKTILCGIAHPPTHQHNNSKNIMVQNNNITMSNQGRSTYIPPINSHKKIKNLYNPSNNSRFATKKSIKKYHKNFDHHANNYKIQSYPTNNHTHHPKNISIVRMHLNKNHRNRLQSKHIITNL